MRTAPKVVMIGGVLTVGVLAIAGAMADENEPRLVAVTATTQYYPQWQGGTTVTSEDPTTAPEPVESVSQQNARRKAEDYLGFSAFSRSGLIKQLEFEGFNNADATYGADSLDTDWYVQAEKKAKDYMDLSGFSRQGLIDQLVYEGFTVDEAEHGVTSVGLVS